MLGGLAGAPPPTGEKLGHAGGRNGELRSLGGGGRKTNEHIEFFFAGSAKYFARGARQLPPAQLVTSSRSALFTDRRPDGHKAISDRLGDNKVRNFAD